MNGPTPATRRLRILSVASAFPYPPTGGTRILIFQQVTEMSRHHDLDLVAVDTTNPDGFDRTGLSDCRSISIVPLSAPERSFSSWEKLTITARTGYPFYLYQRYSSAAQQLVDDHVAQGRYDLIIAEDGEAGLYIRASHPGLKILNKHAIMSVQRQQLADIACSRLRRTMDGAYASLVRRYERSEADRFDLIKLPTQDDVQRWKGIVGPKAASAFAVSNGVDTSYFAYRERSGPIDRLIFTANLEGIQNSDAAEWFIDGVYPRVVAEIGPLPFYVVGRNPPASLREKARISGITVTGTVPDVRPFYGSKPIAVVPLRVASGIINKVLEPMAMGVAVVASPLAVAGLDIPADQVCLVADDAVEFARAIARLVNDESLYRRLTQAAFAYVQEAHVWSKLMARYRERLERAAGIIPTSRDTASEAGLAVTEAPGRRDSMRSRPQGSSRC